MTSLHLFLLILLMRVAHFSYIVTSIIVYGTFKGKKHTVMVRISGTLGKYEQRRL